MDIVAPRNATDNRRMKTIFLCLAAVALLAGCKTTERAIADGYRACGADEGEFEGGVEALVRREIAKPRLMGESDEEAYERGRRIGTRIGMIEKCKNEYVAQDGAGQWCIDNGVWPGDPAFIDCKFRRRAEKAVGWQNIGAGLGGIGAAAYPTYYTLPATPQIAPSTNFYAAPQRFPGGTSTLPRAQAR